MLQPLAEMRYQFEVNIISASRNVQRFNVQPSTLKDLQGRSINHQPSTINHQLTEMRIAQSAKSLRCRNHVPAIRTIGELSV
jgi:hypothetical protein